MAIQHLLLRPAHDAAAAPTAAERTVRAHQRGTGRRHPLWLLAVVAVMLAVVLTSALTSVLAPGASALVRAETGDPASPTTPVTWGVRPADTAHGTGRPNYAYELDPGTTLDDALIVSNYTEDPLTFRVYAADGFMTEVGELDLLPADQESSALGTWVSFEVEEVTIEGGATTTVPFILTVPADATPGDYAAGVVSSLLVETTAGVSVDRRLGARMHLRVAGDLVPAVGVKDVHVSYDGTVNPFSAGDATVTFTVANEGNTRLAADQTVRIAGPWGLGERSAPQVELPEMLPGTSVTRSVTVSGVWPLGRMTASVTVSADVVTAISGAAPVTVVPATGTTSMVVVPWAALLLLALVVIGVLLQVRKVRRRRAGEDRRVAEAVAQALKERDDHLVG